MGDLKVTKMVMKVDLRCSKCYRKIKKVLCSYPQIRDQVYNDKQNTVTITVVCCSPEKIKEKIACNAGDTVESIEIVPDKPPKKEDPPPPKKEDPDPPPPKKEDPPPAQKKPAPAPGLPLVPVPIYPVCVCCCCCYRGGPCYHGRRPSCCCFYRGGPCYHGRGPMCYDGCGRPSYECSGGNRRAGATMAYKIARGSSVH